MSENDVNWLLLLLGPSGAVGFYWGMYRYYRNTDKSHRFEHETAVQAQPVTGSDVRVGTNNGTQESAISGENAGQYRTRVRRISTARGQPE